MKVQLGGWFITVLSALATGQAVAAEEFAASLRLRGGYDGNPILAPGGRGSAMVTADGVFAAGRETTGSSSVWWAKPALRATATRRSSRCRTTRRS